MSAALAQVVRWFQRRRVDRPWDGRERGARKRRERHEAVRRPMAGRQGRRHDERRDLATVPLSMQDSTEDRGSGPVDFRRASARPVNAHGACAAAHTNKTGPAPAAVPTPTGAGEFASEQQARARCPADTIVWVNTLSHVYHYRSVSSHGRSYYRNTKEGAYMCEADAKAEGDRAAARDERHP